MTGVSKKRVAAVAHSVAALTLGFCIATLPAWRLILAVAAFLVITTIYRWRATQAIDDVTEMMTTAFRKSAP